MSPITAVRWATVLVIATKQPTRLDNFALNVAQLQQPQLRVVATRSLSARMWELQPDADAPRFHRRTKRRWSK